MTTLPKTPDVRELFQRSAARHGDRTACRSAAGSLTYSELDATSSHVASRLQAAGLGTGSVVGILPGESLDVVIGILGVLKAGCAFMPFDARTPANRLATMIEMTTPAAILLGDDVDAPDALDGVPVLPLRDTAPSAPSELVEMEADALAYIYFTSGSTGRPKAIAGRFKSIAHFIRWEVEALGVEPGWRVSQLTSPAFDAFLRDLFVPLTTGGRMCIPSDETFSDADALVDWLATTRVQLLHCVPSLLRTLMAVDPPRPLPDLRWVLLSGEPLLPSDVATWYQRPDTSAKLMNLYGPSETTMTKFFYPVEPEDAERRTVPIGKPMPGARAVVLDPRGRACPPRTVGEIHIRTPFRSHGYYRQPELTRTVFVANPFSNDPNEVIYKTGDMGRLLDTGDFEFLGRRDHQVKIRGVRIELPEIEDLLLAHSAVTEAVVIDRDDGSGTKYLAAYLVVDGQVSATDLRRHLLAELPEHYLPSAFVFLESLPRTLTGKIDRRQLPAPERLRDTADTLTEPRSPSEEILAALFARVLGLERVGIHESFFQIGGHSLLATQLLTRVRNALGVEVALRELFEAPTVAGLAAAIDNAGKQELPSLPLVARENRVQALPLSFAQQRLWFLDRLETLGATYNIALGMRLEGRIDRAALTASLGALSQRHEVLRTVFDSRDGEPIQIVGEQAQLPLRVIDLRSVAASQRDRLAAELIETEARQPFDLTRGPLARVTLLQLADESYLGVLNLHHITADAWSLGIFLRELESLYRSGGDAAEAGLAELPVQYGDFATWQRRWLTGDVLQNELDYWRQSLSDAETSAELPKDRPRPAMPSYRGGRVLGSMTAAATSRITRLAQEADATLFMAQLAGFAALLHRYTGGVRFNVGTPVANRTRAEVEGLIGFFVNTLVLRLVLAGEPSFAELVRRVREISLGAYAHQELPFEKLVEEIQPERDLASTPLFQVAFVLQNAPLEPLELPGATLTPVPLETGTAKFDLTLTLAPQGEGQDVTVEFAADLFDRSTAERLLRDYLHLLEEAMANPRCKVSELNLLSPAARQQLMREWNDSAAAYSSDLLLHQLFERRAATHGDAVAVSFEASALSYQALDRRAQQLADRLAEKGCSRESPIAICLERSPELMVALFGVLKAGGAYLPLDPDYPEDRLRFMLRDSGARVLISDRSHRDLAGSTTPLLRVDQPVRSSSPSPQAPSPQEPSSSPAGLAYVIYTSGSTGRPKGVAMSHRAIVNRLLWMQDRYGLQATDTVLQKTPMSFDVSVWEFFWPLAVGARLELARPGGHRDSAYLADLIVERAITALHFVPSMLQAFLAGQDLAAAGALRHVFTSGEALGAGLAEQYHRRADAPLHNLYGPTEAAVDVTFHAVPPVRQPRPVPIGRPIANTRIHLLGRQLHPLPVGAAGELTIGGTNLARGYLRRAGLTAERFVPDSCGERCGERLYRTGDLARHRADGAIEFLGRLDHQVKLRGFRIELDEIRAVLCQHPRLAEAVVVTRNDGPAGDLRLVAFAVPMAGSEPALDELRQFLGQRLPDYMVPAAFVFIDALPLTPSGKIDRRSLPAAPAPTPSSDLSAARWASPTEELLAGLWEEILERSSIGPEDDFFHLGGHSLLATRVMARIVEIFGAELPLRDLFANPTPRRLASRIEEARGQDTIPAPALVPIPRDTPAPLSFAQQRLWFLDHLEPASAAYNLPLALDLRGTLDLDALGRALDEIVRRHEVLRTTLATVDGRPIQIVGEPCGSALPVIDLGHLAPGQRGREQRLLIEAEAARPFHLAARPWLRLALLRLATDHWTLLVTMHHIASDGLSLEIFYGELTTLYRAYRRGESSPLADLPVQYGDFAVWQRRCLTDETLATELGYWRDRLADLPLLTTLPADRPRPSTRRWTAGVVGSDLSRDLTGKLRDLARQRGASLFMVVLAAFAALLRRSGSEPIVPIGVPVAGRNRSQLENLIGFFVNTVIVPAGADGDLRFASLIDRIRDAVLESFAHQAAPFEKLVDELAPERALSHSPLFQVMLAWQNASRRSLEVEDLRLTPVGAVNTRAKFDLTLVVRESDRGLRYDLEYGREIFDRTTALRLTRGLTKLLIDAGTAPQHRLSELTLLEPAESHQLLHGWNDISDREDRLSGVVARFLHRANRDPQATALRWRSQRISYGQLADRVLGLATELRRCGVGPDKVVGIYFTRSPELVTSVLAVLAAGGAYLPLDPSYPEERLGFMLSDSAARWVIGDRSSAPRTLRSRVQWIAGEPPAGSAANGTTIESPHPESLAYVIYTSGSTGRPKGTAISHRALARYLAWCTSVYVGPAGGDAPLASSIGFDLTVTSLFTPLLTGGSITLVGDERDPEGLTEALAEGGFDLVKVTPSHLALLERGLSGDQMAAATRLLILGGEALTGERLAGWRRQAPQARLINEYGPTEATVGCAVYEVGSDLPSDDVPIGRPISGANLRVLDPHFYPSPSGVPGELHIGGQGLARSYLGRPARTALSFRPDPWSQEPGARLYATGDSARWRFDGHLLFLGRIDRQLKVRGFRIEPGEIETALARLPGVAAAAVATRADEKQASRLVAWVVAEPGADLETSALRHQLAEWLPAHCLPAAFVFLDELPLTAHGKVDEDSLPDPRVERPELATTFETPRDRAEQKLTRIWAEVLRLDRVGVHDNFFHLGGDSILSIQIVSRANQAGLHFTVRQIFEHQTVAALATVAETVAPIEAEQGTVQGTFSLTPAARWFFEQQLVEPQHYNQALLLAAPEHLDAPALDQALNTLLRHHDALRLRFEQTADGWSQEIAPRAFTTSRVHDLSGLADGDRDAALSHLTSELQTSLRLDRPPLLRAAIFRLGHSRRDRLLLLLHHLIVDGVSWRVLLEDLEATYNDLRRGRQPSLPTKTTSFKRWSELLCEKADTTEIALELDYWLASRRFAAPALPVDFTDRANLVASEASVTVALSEGETEILLTQVPQAYRTEINDVLLTPFAQALGAWTNSSELLIDLEGHGREDLFPGIDLARTVGWFTSIFPVLLSVPKAADLGTTLMDVKEQLRDVPSRGISYGLLRYLATGDSSSRLVAMPAAEVSFNYLGQLDRAGGSATALEPAPESVGALRSPRQERRYLLEVNGRVYDQRLWITVLFGGRHRRSTIEHLANTYLQRLRDLIDHCSSDSAGGVTPSDFPLAELDQSALLNAISQVGQAKD
ncbi:MAG: amino acid adenylation domain-containing protein [Acidobacteriota bacterium]